MQRRRSIRAWWPPVAGAVVLMILGTSCASTAAGTGATVPIAQIKVLMTQARDTDGTVVSDEVDTLCATVFPEFPDPLIFTDRPAVRYDAVATPLGVDCGFFTEHCIMTLRIEPRREPTQAEPVVPPLVPATPVGLNLDDLGENYVDHIARDELTITELLHQPDVRNACGVPTEVLSSSISYLIAARGRIV